MIWSIEVKEKPRRKGIMRVFVVLKLMGTVRVNVPMR